MEEPPAPLRIGGSRCECPGPGHMLQRQFHAPSGNRDILSVPDFSVLPRLIESNQRLLNSAAIAISGVPLLRVRQEARQEILALCNHSEGSSAPLLLTGHQPELFHPGVWVKNFALAGLARKLGGVSLNLIVDNDTLKSTALRFPTFGDNDPASVHSTNVPFDRFTGETPYEDRAVLDAELFRSFPERAAPLWRNWGYQPLLPAVWRVERTIGEAFVAARRQCEESWGCRNLELTVSRLSQTQAFQRFARHIFDDLARFREVYNRAIGRYRQLNRVRSRNHPAPLLAADEAPFWVRRAAAGRDRARRGDAGEPLLPRALTLTLFARVCLGDFFIHGIGGGKYDEVTDEIIREYFGVAAPAFQVLSATLHLPLPHFAAAQADVKRTHLRVRDLYWNPQRHLVPERAAQRAIKELLDEKELRIHNEPPLADHAARRQWFRELRQATEQLRGLVEDQRTLAEEDHRRLREEVSANEVLERRDYSWVLYPEEVLRSFMTGFLIF